MKDFLFETYPLIVCFFGVCNYLLVFNMCGYMCEGSGSSTGTGPDVFIGEFRQKLVVTSRKQVVGTPSILIKLG